MRFGKGFDSEIFFEVKKMSDIYKQEFTIIFAKNGKRIENLDDSDKRLRV